MFQNLYQKATKLALAGALLAGVLFPSLSASAAAVNITVQGSTTIHPISTFVTTQFPSDYPDVTMTGYDGSLGSGTGQAKLFAGLIDVAQSSSSCKDTNANPGLYGPTLYTCADIDSVEIGRDAFLIIVNAAKTCVSEITTQQVADIYRGAITNWNQLSAACASEPLIARSRATTSGTYTTLIDFIKSTSTPGITTVTTAAQEAATITATGLGRLQTAQEMQAAIAANPGQIGYEGLGNLDAGVKFLSVKGTGAYIAPSTATVLDGTYPFGRKLYYMHVKASVMGANFKGRIADLMTWTRGPKGQAIVKVTGFVPILPVAPDWDVNGDQVADIGDIGVIGNYWGQQGSAHWVRADANKDGVIDIGDVGYVGNYWGQTWP